MLILRINRNCLLLLQICFYSYVDAFFIRDKEGCFKYKTERWYNCFVEEGSLGWG